MKKTIISLGVFKDSGGPTKTIGAFKSALGAELFSFCNSKLLAKQGLAISGAEGVLTSSLPVLRQFCYAGRSLTSIAEQEFADSGIISCHSFYRYHALWVNQMSRKYSVPYWFVPHGILDPWVMKSGRLVKKAFWSVGGRRFVDDASTVIFSTSVERDKALSQFELPGTEVIPWPVELVDCSGREIHRRRIRDELKIPEEAKVLLYFGRVHSMKKPLETIRAIAAAAVENLHLVIVGNEQDVSLGDCDRVADELGVRSRVHLIGPVYGEQKYQYMFASDGYISLSHRENFNHTAAESLSAGLPLILSLGNDLQGDIASEQCSWGLVDDELITASDAIEEFSATSSAELTAMGIRGRNWVSQNLKFDLFKNRLLALASSFQRG